MNKLQLVILSLAFGALIGTTLHPGFPEIVIVTMVVLGLFALRRQRVVPQTV